jgi:hypothetical protein
MPWIPASQFFDADVYHPVISVTLSVPGHEPVQIPALVDTGADKTLVPAPLMPILWDDMAETGRTNFGIGGEADCRTCDGTLSYRGVEFVHWLTIIQADYDKMPFAILGREDFLRFFRFEFDWIGTDRRFRLTKVRA